MKNRINYLESRFSSNRQRLRLEKKYINQFEKQARYQGNGIYSWGEILCTDTRELFLTGILISESIPFKQI